MKKDSVTIQRTMCMCCMCRMLVSQASNMVRGEAHLPDALI